MHPSVEKEVVNSDRFRDNLRRLSFWRLGAIIKQGRYCRESLDKAFSLSGHTGHPIFDLWVYVVQTLPWFLPATFILIPGLFAALVTFVSGLLSVVVKEPKIIQKTIEVPFFWFFTTSTTISETIMVPVLRPPDIRVAITVAIAMIIIGIMILSAILKWMFLFELSFRRKLLLKHAARTDF